MIFVYLVSILAGLLLGISESINKNITEEKYSVFSYFFIQIAGNFIIYLVPFLFYAVFPHDLTGYIYVLIIVVLIFFANASIIKAYKSEDISSVNIISRISLVIGFLSGVILLHETINLFNITGVVLIILGILTIFYERKLTKPSAGSLYAFSSGVLYGFIAYFVKLALGYFNIPTYLVIYSILTLILLSFIPKTFKDIKPILTKYKNKIILSRIIAASVFYLIVWSFQKGNISIVNTNYETAFLLSGVFVGIIVLNEKKNIAKKLAGSLLCILGIILLNFF